MVVNYLLMLVAMTYNIWLFLAAVTGSSAGHFIFNPNAKAVLAAAWTTAPSVQQPGCHRSSNTTNYGAIVEQRGVAAAAADPWEFGEGDDVLREDALGNESVGAAAVVRKEDEVRGGPRVIQVDVHHCPPPDADAENSPRQEKSPQQSEEQPTAVC